MWTGGELGQLSGTLVLHEFGRVGEASVTEAAAGRLVSSHVGAKRTLSGKLLPTNGAGEQSGIRAPPPSPVVTQ